MIVISSSSNPFNAIAVYSLPNSTALQMMKTGPGYQNLLSHRFQSRRRPHTHTRPFQRGASPPAQRPGPASDPGQGRALPANLLLFKARGPVVFLPTARPCPRRPCTAAERVRGRPGHLTHLRAPPEQWREKGCSHRRAETTPEGPGGRGVTARGCSARGRLPRAPAASRQLAPPVGCVSWVGIRFDPSLRVGP